MNAAVVRLKYKKTDLDKAAKEYKEQVLPAIATHQGGRSAFLLINRETGDGISVAMYENEASAKSFAPKAEKLIDSMKKYTAAGENPKRELYEVAAGTQAEAKAVAERAIKAFNARAREARARRGATNTESP